MEVSDFVFSECIKRMDYTPVIESLSKKRKFFSFLLFAEKRLEKRIEEIEKLQKATDERFNFWDWFFDEMQSQSLCKAKHNIYKEMPTVFLNHEEDHQVWIEGEGYAEFEIDGKPEFSISDGGKNRETRVPILEGSQPAKLILHDYPKTDLPPFGKIYIEYKFNTRFYLGDYVDKKPNNFTENPMENKSFDWRLFYGKPGCVYFRLDDRIEEELNKSVWPYYDRERFEMEGKIYSGNELFFQGNMSNTGTFPFFITKDKRKPRNDSPKGRLPVGDVLVNV